MSQNICTFFLQSRCKFGRKCRFKHQYICIGSDKIKSDYVGFNTMQMEENKRKLALAEEFKNDKTKYEKIIRMDIKTGAEIDLKNKDENSVWITVGHQHKLKLFDELSNIWKDVGNINITGICDIIMDYCFTQINHGDYTVDEYKNLPIYNPIRMNECEFCKESGFSNKLTVHGVYPHGIKCLVCISNPIKIYIIIGNLFIGFCEFCTSAKGLTTHKCNTKNMKCRLCIINKICKYSYIDHKNKKDFVINYASKICPYKINKFLTNLNKISIQGYYYFEKYIDQKSLEIKKIDQNINQNEEFNEQKKICFASILHFGKRMTQKCPDGIIIGRCTHCNGHTTQMYVDDKITLCSNDNCWKPYLFVRPKYDVSGCTLCTDEH